MIEVTTEELDLLIHAAATGAPGLAARDKEQVRELIQRLQEISDGPA